MKTEHTNRGFRIIEFVDHHGDACSLQKSSLATEDCIWLGRDEADPKMFIPHGDPAWQPLPLPDLPAGGHISFKTRMHLTREQVAELLPVLHHFADTGELPEGGP